MMGQYMQDPAIKNAFLLSLTSVLRDGLMSKGMKFREAFVIGLADWVYWKFLQNLVVGPLSKISGETYYAEMAGEAIGLTLVLMLTKRLGVQSAAGSDVPEGFIDMPRVGSGMVGDLFEGALQAAELMAERGLVSFGGAKLGVL
jgi:hypothetical protein